MSNFSENNNKKSKTLNLMQVFGLILFIFSAIVFLCIATGGVIFGAIIGKDIFRFLLGTFGWSSYAFFAAGIYSGMAMFLGRRPFIKKRKKLIQAIVLFVIIGLILQLATSNSFIKDPIPSYGKYLSSAYNAGEAVKTATFGGVIFGLVVYPFFRLLTPIVCYVIFSIATVVLVFFLFNMNRLFKTKTGNEYFEKPELKIKGYKDYDLNLQETEGLEIPEKVATAPRKLFVGDVGDYVKPNKKSSNKGKAYDILIGDKNQEVPAPTSLAYTSAGNSADILFKKPDVGKSMGKELFNSNDTYVESFDKSLEEKKKYILTPPDPTTVYARDLDSLNRSRDDSGKAMPKFIHDKSEDKRKKKYNVLENQMTAYDIYSENSEFDDVEYDYDELHEPLNKHKKTERETKRQNDIIHEGSLNDYSSKNIFDAAKKQNLINNINRPEIISDSYREQYTSASEARQRGETVRENEVKHQVDDFFSKVSENKASDIQSSDYIEYSLYNAPPLELLRDPKFDDGDMIEDYDEKAGLLEQTLEDFRINAKVVNITPGSSVTRYELQMPPGMPVSRILSRSDDIAMALASVGDVRIEAPIPGKNLLGIEIPNSKRKLVVLKEVLNTKEFFEAKSKLSFALGKDIGGKNHIVDIAKMPHLLIAGSTGSGKSVCLNALLISILYKSSPEDVRVILIDPKRVEFNIYADLPHLLIKNIINEQEKAISALNWAIFEMERRFALFKKCNAKDIDSYNERIDKSVENKLARILIVVDELAELMASKKAGEVEEKIQRLAQLSRAAGIHLVLATQRPSVDVITGLIKANMPSRIAFRVISQIDSRTIMDVSGAEKLLGDGDMIFKSANTPKPIRMQCPFISMDEIENVIDFIKNNNDAYFDDKISDNIMAENRGGSSSGGGYNHDEQDSYTLDVLKLAIESNQISISMVQRRFAVGYARAGKIIDDLERQGLISALDGSKPRQVLITMSEFRERFGDI